MMIAALIATFVHTEFSRLAWQALFAIAVVGMVSSSVYLLLALVAALRDRRKGEDEGQAPPDDALLAVTILKPLHGFEPRLEENLESFFVQDYFAQGRPRFEIVFGCRDATDAAVEVVERLRRRFPHVPAKLVFSGPPRWPSAKVWSLAKMVEAATGEIFAISDSDILVPQDFLRRVVPPLLIREARQENGLVTCLYRGVPASGFWSRMEALGMSVEFASGVLVAQMLEGMSFALGAAMVLRRTMLEEIGGFRALADYYSDDFVLGRRVAEAGYRVRLSPCRVGHVLCETSFRKTFATQRRWMQSTRYSRPLGHLGTGLTYAVPYGVLAALAGCALGHPALGACLLLASWLNRVVQSVAVGYGAIGDPRALRMAWLYPVRDLVGFAAWVASYGGGREFPWRGERYRFGPEGRIEAVERVSS